MVGSSGVVLQTGGIGALLVLIVLVVAAIAVWSSVVVVNPYEKQVLTVLGEYRGLLEPGINLVPPFVSTTHSIDTRTQRLTVAYDEPSAWDDLSVTAVVDVTVVDPERAFLEVDDHAAAVSNLARTTLEEAVTEGDRDGIVDPEGLADRIRRDLEEPTDRWGIRVEAVEIREDAPAEERASPSGER